ncbi:MAG: hypothetical protein WC323_02870 [Patescibacteria group bacterium]|jgi:hypothetical protein
MAITSTEITIEELHKRQAVFAKKPEVILLKIFAMGPLEGLERKDFNETATDAKHASEAEKRGLKFQAYRVKGDTGLCLFKKEPEVRVSRLLRQLANRGYVYTGGHWQERPGRGSVNTLEFRLGGEEAEMSQAVRQILEKRRFNHCTVWCNLKYGDPQDQSAGQFRLDTINLAKGLVTSEPSRQLVIEGNTYRLEADK